MLMLAPVALVPPVEFAGTNDEYLAGAEAELFLFYPPPQVPAHHVMNLKRPQVAVRRQSSCQGSMKSQPAKNGQLRQQLSALFVGFPFVATAPDGQVPNDAFRELLRHRFQSPKPTAT